jgi:CheY-like chemotaxis protein
VSRLAQLLLENPVFALGSGEAVAAQVHTHQVLLVEDDSIIREMLCLLFASEGLRVTQAKDGAQAIDIISQLERSNQEICAIVLDMMLPKVDGLGVLSYLKGRETLIPVIAMSADSELLSRALLNGAHAAIAKPFALEDILPLVTSHCRSGKR